MPIGHYLAKFRKYRDGWEFIRVYGFTVVDGGEFDENSLEAH